MIIIFAIVMLNFDVFLRFLALSVCLWHSSEQVYRIAMILIILLSFVAYLAWFFWEIYHNDMLKDVSGGHEVPLLKPGLDLVYSNTGEIICKKIIIHSISSKSTLCFLRKFVSISPKEC